MSTYDSKSKFNKVESAWAIRAGVKGSADIYFMNDAIIVLNDPGLGDLNQIEPTRQAFYRACSLVLPNDSRSSITGIGGKFYRFVYEIRIGDVVLYPSLINQLIYCGEIIGKYKYNIKNKEYPHQRKVRWITSFPKSSLSKAARYELGAARTLFKYNKNLGEVIYKLKHHTDLV